MNDREAFIQACLANPDDVELRLVFADWLDERGGPAGNNLRKLVAAWDVAKQLPLPPRPSQWQMFWWDFRGTTPHDLLSSLPEEELRFLALLSLRYMPPLKKEKKDIAIAELMSCGVFKLNHEFRYFQELRLIILQDAYTSTNLSELSEMSATLGVMLGRGNSHLLHAKEICIARSSEVYGPVYLQRVMWMLNLNEAIKKNIPNL